MTNKYLYRKFCKLEKDIPIFSKDWWLDSVCGVDNWDVCLVEKSGRIIGAMPYYIRKRLGFTILTQPPLTQKLGPWILPSEKKYAKVLSYQKDVMNRLIEQLPKFHYFNQSWHHSNKNWLPFYWKEFSQTTRYTYILNRLENKNILWKEMNSNIRGDIRKAKDRFHLRVRNDLNIKEYLELNAKTFFRQGMKVPYSNQLVENIDTACGEHGCRKIWIAKDDKGKQHAAVYIIWDEKSAYYLMGGSDPEYRNSGAVSLVMWEAIKHAATVTKKFDFDGSMIEPVEKFFRAFGAIQTPYFSISKTPSRLLRMYENLKQIIKQP